jgi:preprotein translocase subunit SecG
VLLAALFTLTNFVVLLHVIVSVALIILVLLHSGRGGGVSEMFGGVQSAAAGSTVVERNLDRITVAAAVIFAFTTIILAIRLQ